MLITHFNLEPRLRMSWSYTSTPPICLNGVYKIFTFFTAVLYGCETWSLTLREEHRLRVFENRVLRGIFGSKRDGVTGEWRRLHNEELNDLY
jgi:hypothetical protein